MKNVEKNTIESKINELENISKILDNPELSLQESIKLVKRAKELTSEIENELNEAKKDLNI
ncbi:MAG: exodeoxyribonuclease VII small subunit [Candidatus Onthovivens sp.]|nr:exodeoxyribonuclease VII small subunit [Candidatus Onthovivens sp.]